MRDANGCESAITTVAVGTNTPTITFTATPSDETCTGNDGQIAISGETGGTAPYEYSIDGGAYQTSATFGTLSAGSYDIQIRDDNGCESAVSSVSVGNNCCGAGTFTITFDTDNPDCNGGTDGEIEVTSVTGGTAPYEYSIDGGSTYQNPTTFSGLSAGPYTITVRDNVGCTDDESTLLTEPTAITYTASITQESCLGGDGEIVLTPSGGVAGGSPGTLYFEDFDPTPPGQTTPNWTDPAFSDAVDSSLLILGAGSQGWIINTDLTGLPGLSDGAVPTPGSGGNKACLGIVTGSLAGTVGVNGTTLMLDATDESIIKTDPISTTGQFGVGVNFLYLNGNTDVGELFYRTTASGGWVFVDTYDDIPVWVPASVTAGALGNALDNQASVELAFVYDYSEFPDPNTDPSFCVDDIEIFLDV